MAKLKSFVKMQGTIDGLTFFKSKDGYLVRTQGGVSKERIMNDPAFARTRENGTEFGSTASAGKLFRVSVGTLISNAKDGTLTARMMKVLTKVKNLDLLSERGLRTVANGINSAEGKQLMMGFDMNSRSNLTSVLRSPYILTTADGKVAIANFVPKVGLLYPPHATHVSLLCAFLNLNFVTGAYEISLSPATNLAIDMTSTSVLLNPGLAPEGTGIQFYFLLIEFFQMVNGIQYPLNNGAYNALTVTGVV